MKLAKTSCSRHLSSWQFPIRAFSVTLNQSSKIGLRDIRLKLKRRNKSLGYSDGIISHIAGCAQFTEIRHEISQCTTSAEVVSILHKLAQNKESEEAPIDESVYGKALQKCLALTDWRCALKIFETIPMANRSVIIYNIVINGLCKNDRIQNALQLLEKMKSSTSSRPDLKTYSSLITGCKHRWRSNWKIAEKLWSEMIGRGLRPNVIAYNAMITIYVQMQQIDKVEALWMELLESLRNSESSNSNDSGIGKHTVALSAVCGNLMNCYALQQRTDKVMAMKEWMLRHQVPMSNIHYSIMLKCFERAGAPEKVVEVFNSEIVRNSDIKLEPILVCQVAVALLQIMRKHPEDTALHKKHCKMIVDTIPRQYAALWSIWKDSHPSNYWLGKIQFDALLFRYSVKGKEHRLGRKFKKLVKTGKLHGIWTRDLNELKGDCCIDLHSHSEDAALWILKFVLQYNRKERRIVEQILDHGKDVVILCGKGSHSNNHHQPKLNQRVIEELASWTPPISASQYPLNNACLLLNPNDLRTFFNSTSVS